MIVSRQMAAEAMKDLGIAGWGFDEDQINKTYRAAVKVVHPDVGGSAEAFAKVDRAKCVLLAWLRRPQAKSALDELISSNTCKRCEGTGRVKVGRGFATMTMVCAACRGAGELVEREKDEQG